MKVDKVDNTLQTGAHDLEGSERTVGGGGGVVPNPILSKISFPVAMKTW